MLALDTAQLALLATRVVGVVWLVELDFTSGQICLTSMNVPLEIGGKTYRAAGDLLAVGELKESLDPSTQPIALRLSVANPAVLASALGNVESYRGKAARLYLQLVDEVHRPVGVPRLRYTGYMQPVKIERDQPGPDGGVVGGSIELPLTSAGLSRARNVEGLRLSDEQQRARFPGDRGLEYLAGLIKQPALWLSTAFQQER
ncbi:hypothetical protein RQP53_03540 [Paucibacter sp. APW11]|uniref:DUF2163 domain-containing protein n=1 Tax=Roseateles aquae TaxID=3077235 RepID=A0ABU3P707_9BURK|nr:hypothetical protein [Paucibacter sp. APW11]MDT8998346.1 hypothetical protein [Paucibacter sp. APW11]